MQFRALSQHFRQRDKPEQMLYEPVKPFVAICVLWSAIVSELTNPQF